MSTMKSQQSAEMPILIYSQIRGIAQPIRNLFYYLGIKFKQENISNVRQLEAGFTTGYPKLIYDGFQITDSIAIFRHVCRVYDRNDLLGLTPQNRAIINQFLFHYSDVRSKVVKKIGEGARLAFGKTAQGDIYQIKINVAKNIMEEQCKIIKQLIQMHMKNKGWIVNHLTIADFFFYELCFYIVNFLGSSLKNSLIYRNFQVFLQQFQNQDFFKQNRQQIMSRKIFMPFKDKEAQEIMTNFWEGDKQMIA